MSGFTESNTVEQMTIDSTGGFQTDSVSKTESVSRVIGLFEDKG